MKKRVRDLLELAAAVRRDGVVLDCRYLFRFLLLLVRPATVCDVGSCDGAEAFAFRRLRRRARVIAFEANPDNFAAIAADPRSSQIELRPEAASDIDGEKTFYVLEVPPDQPWAKGGSSLNRRGPEISLGLAERPIQVRARRLDTALADAPAPIALWVDVEGAADELVRGITGIADRVAFVCIELEPRPLWTGQAPASAVLDRLSALGFERISTSPDSFRQDNVVLVRDLSRPVIWLAKILTLSAQVVRRLVA